jgi:sec-independent protein translocase protein TatB
MLGLDWTELALIAVVAVVVIGPKDLPDAVRGIAKGIQKLRRMAGEFQGQVDEVVREAKLEDVRNQINDIRNFNMRDIVEKEIDKDGSIRKTFTEDPIGNPLRDAFQDTPPPVHGAEVTPPPVSADAGAAPAVAAPAFIPPGVAPPPAAYAAAPSTPEPQAAVTAPPAPAAPAFVPPPGSAS